MTSSARSDSAIKPASLRECVTHCRDAASSVSGARTRRCIVPRAAPCAPPALGPAGQHLQNVDERAGRVAALPQVGVVVDRDKHHPCPEMAHQERPAGRNPVTPGHHDASDLPRPDERAPPRGGGRRRPRPRRRRRTRPRAACAQRVLQRAFDTARVRAAVLAHQDHAGSPGTPPRPARAARSLESGHRAAAGASRQHGPRTITS